MAIAEEWLIHEDEKCRQARLDRLEWLANITSKNGNWLFHGGQLTKYLFEEARYCFVYGQFLAAIILGLSFVEHSLASILFGWGRNDLERANFSDLIKEALDQGIIDQNENLHIEKARSIRNAITHFRQPGDEERIELTTIIQNAQPYEIIENEARNVMEIVLHLLDRFSEVL